MKNLGGRVAVITGAGSGIGRALARAFAEQGCHLALVDIDENGLLATMGECKELKAFEGRRITTHVCDVSQRQAMADLPRLIEQQHGAIHLLFNNAGVTINKPFEEHSMEDMDFVLGIDLWGVIYGCHYFLPILKKQDEAHIINTSSLAGLLGLPNQSSYCLSKAAVKALSESLYAELAVHNIGVTSILPGTISTNILRSAAGRSGAGETTALKLAGLMERHGMSPDRLAGKVVKAVRRGRMQVRIGFDSYLGDWLKRLFPRAVHWPLKWGFARSRIDDSV